MTDETDAPPPKKKKKGKKLLILLVGLLLVGGGAGAGLYFSGILGSEEATAEDAAKADRPQLVEKTDGQGTAEKGKYETSYFPLEKEFTSNLKDSVHFVQMGVAVSTNYDERVIQAVEKHQLAIRSAILMNISETDEELVFTTEGKRQVQARLTKAINDVLVEKEGFGGVGNVYFTNFIVQ